MSGAGLTNDVRKSIVNSLALAFNAADVVSPLQMNPRSKGVLLTIVTANRSGDTTATIRLRWADPTNGTFVDIPGAITAAIATNGTTALLAYPGATVVANQAISQPVGAGFVAVVDTAGTSGAIDVRIDAQLLA